jgi:hypothetical protein
MKPYRIAYLIAIACIALSAVSCVTSTTTTTAPDGTVTEQKITAPSSDALNAAVAGAGILAPIIRGK